MSSHYVGQRLSLKGQICTVQYVGAVQNKSGEWLGVEWDDPARGKHNGTHEGVKYFECKFSQDLETIADANKMARSLSRCLEQSSLAHIRQKQITHNRFVSQAKSAMGQTKDFLSSTAREVHV